MKAESILRGYFPHLQAFKHGQLQVIAALLRGESAAAIFPTGGGKSLCYQLPGLALGQQGLTLVVSPLLALMKDQVDAMKRLGHPVDLLASSQTWDEKIAVKNRVKARQTSILYVAPEQLNNEGSVALIRSVPIALMAVDEAHCISEWGNAFRPDYLRLANLRRELGVTRIVALTATATPAVERDICKGFDIDPKNCVRTSFFRPNLNLSFTPTSAADRDNKLVRAIQTNEPTGATIVYATIQKSTEHVAKMLVQNGFQARAYHAGMKQEDRKETQEWFMEESSESRVVCATVAFGMGVDKSNIRYVYHYNLPKSLECYAQEIGRAGRDGEVSHCEVFCNLEDVAQLEAFAYCGSPSQNAIKGVLNDVFLQQNGTPYRAGVERIISHYSMGKANDMSDNGIQMLLAFVDIYHGSIKQGTPRYSQYKVKPKMGGRAVNGILTQSGDPAAAHLIRFGDTKKIWTHIDIPAATACGRFTRNELVAALSKLEQQNILEVMPSQLEHVYYIQQVPSNLERLSKELYERFQAREKQELARIGQVLAFITADDCHAKLLTNHFEGEKGPSSIESNGPSPFPCGACPHCIHGSPVELPKLEGFTVDPNLWQALESDPSIPKDDPHLIARFALGFKSPRILQLKLPNNRNFGILEGAHFSQVMAMIMERLFPHLAR